MYGEIRILEPVWSLDCAETVVALAENPAERQVLVATAQGFVSLVNLKTGKMLMTYPGHELGITSLAWLKGGKQFLSAGLDGFVRLWDINSPQPVREFDFQKAWIQVLYYDPKRELLFVAAGRRLKCLDIQGNLQREFADVGSTILDIVPNPMGDSIATAQYGGVSFWSANQSAVMRMFPYAGSLLKLAWSPDGKMLAAGVQDGSIRFWYTKTGEDLEMTGYPRRVNQLAWDGTSRFLASGSMQSVLVWNCSGQGPSGRDPIILGGHQGEVVTLAYMQKGNYLASGCDEGNAYLWTPGVKKLPVASLPDGEAYTLLRWTRKEDALLAARGDGTLSLTTFGAQ